MFKQSATTKLVSMYFFQIFVAFSENLKFTCFPSSIEKEHPFSQQYSSSRTRKRSYSHQDFFLTANVDNCSNKILLFNFSGNCTGLTEQLFPMSDEEIIERTWHLTSRISTIDCHTKILQVFCAIQYQPNGFCSPPNFSSQLYPGGHHMLLILEL